MCDEGKRDANRRTHKRADVRLGRATTMKLLIIQKLSVLGLKNLVHEKTDIPPEQMILYLIKKHKNQTAANDRMELGETLDSKDDVAFLRDYPTLQNGSTLHVVHAS